MSCDRPYSARPSPARRLCFASCLPQSEQGERFASAFGGASGLVARLGRKPNPPLVQPAQITVLLVPPIPKAWVQVDVIPAEALEEVQQRYLRQPGQAKAAPLDSGTLLTTCEVDEAAGFSYPVLVNFDLVQVPAAISLPVLQKRPLNPPFEVRWQGSSEGGGCAACSPTTTPHISYHQSGPDDLQVRMRWRSPLPLHFKVNAKAFAVSEEGLDQVCHVVPLAAASLHSRHRPTTPCHSPSCSSVFHADMHVSWWNHRARCSCCS
jgi:hypothetical protein